MESVTQTKHSPELFAELVKALEDTLDVLDNMTTDDFERGKDRKVRERAREALKKAKNTVTL